MYECFQCGKKTVVWDNSYTLDEYGYVDEGEGIVHECHCTNCGADILYIVRFDDENHP